MPNRIERENEKLRQMDEMNEKLDKIIAMLEVDLEQKDCKKTKKTNKS